MRVGLVLAAGHSRRFGVDDKLLAHLNGRRLCSYAFETLSTLGLDASLACVQSDQVAEIANAAGIEVLHVPEGAQQSDSIRIGVCEAKARGATQVLIMLADMPYVPAAHMAALFEMAHTMAAASRFGDQTLPPAVFPASYFVELMALKGDQGAGRVIKALPEKQILSLPAHALLDIDTLCDLRLAHRT
ncbi:nucleotidyltransferase family protein [Pacificibacter marinus]|uniref:Purine catabolism protein PucB n=1 Tax=Pacificibacter marinus TaxID=658057 RepID=A0A1Y5RTW3_9RHOB|nr:nucleotidyltransferase family protein [Pacificibacter marinus]SEK40083.1 molybdenum cofactor cytidylyltransferase [Pacificibacter marinus]SLN25356.1 Purine catabolism protein PucB [Pacificibacter marinus]